MRGLRLVNSKRLKVPRELLSSRRGHWRPSHAFPIRHLVRDRVLLLLYLTSAASCDASFILHHDQSVPVAEIGIALIQV